MATRPATVTVLSIDDASLVEQARAGDERAFVALFKRYSRYVAGVAYRLLGDSSEVEDVVQEAFTDASQHMDQLRDGAGFKSWLVTICVRRVHKRLARRRRWRWFVSEAVHFEPTTTDPELRAKVVAIYQALEGVAVDDRVAWVLHHIEGETLPVVAEQCAVSLATIKRRIARAEEVIERRLHDH
ncbi:MAG: sigma-70 family RNA polymerase sigma factor [Polyangiales bacterium]